MKNKVDETETRVLKALAGTAQPQDNLIHLSTGVILRGRQSPPLVLMTVMASFPRPKPPVVYIEAMGREMENPDNPDYLERIKDWKTEQSNAMLVALISTGTELQSKPKGVPGPEDDQWLEEYSLLGLPMHKENKAWRYLRWVQFKAIASEADTQCIMEVVGRLSGIPEKAAKTAEDFPGSDEAGR